MFEVLLGSVLGLNLLLMATLWLKNAELTKIVEGLANKVGNELQNIEIEVPSLDILREEIFAILGNMHTPTFMDHIGGAVANLMQARAHKAMQELAPSLEMLNNDLENSGAHG